MYIYLRSFFSILFIHCIKHYIILCYLKTADIIPMIGLVIFTHLKLWVVVARHNLPVGENLNTSNFQPLEVVAHGSETQFQVGLD